ncbi:hypothetical protein vseg_000719 [Gypsophila vaccaria]
MDPPKFVIESSEAEAMAKKQGLNSALQLLPFIARSARKLARIPISGFAVGAVGLTSDGRIFIGVNVEFPKLPLHHSIHAEQFLTINLSRYSRSIVSNVVVSAYPCGHCRQFLQEVRGASDIQIFVLPNNGDGDDNLVRVNGFSDTCHEGDFRPLSYFLPHRFGPDDLLEKDVPLILEARENGLVLLNASGQNGNNNNNTKNGFVLPDYDLKKALFAALDAANRSHAPYSACPSGISLVDKNGNVYKGSYMESAAYNPSLGPMQAAVIDYIATTGATAEEAEAGYGDIIGAVLVEKEGALVRQEETVKLFVMTVFPNCELHVFHCRNSNSDVEGKLGN